MVQEGMVCIPSQGWYNLVVHDATAKELHHALEMTGIEDEEQVLHAIEKGLDFINDRYVDKSYSDTDPNLPTESDLRAKKDLLTTMKRSLE